MNGSGWFGPVDQMLYVLDTIGADRDGDGKFKLFVSAPCIGLDGDCAVPADCMCEVRGQRMSVAYQMNTTSYGTRGIVIYGLMMMALVLPACGTARGLIDGAGHLGQGVIQDVRGMAVGISEANQRSTRQGEYH